MPILTDKTALTAVAVDDLVHVVDVSDTTDDATGSSKKVAVSDLVKAAGGMTFTSKELVEEIINEPSSTVIFTVPSGYDRLIIQGICATDNALTVDTASIYINGDETKANYYKQRGVVRNGSLSSPESTTGDSEIIVCAGANSSSDLSSFEIAIENPDASGLIKTIRSNYGMREDADTSWVGMNTVSHKTDDTPITTIRIADATGVADLRGTFRLYGEKQVTSTQTMPNMALTAKELIDEYDGDTDGSDQYVFDNIPQIYDRLIVEVELQSYRTGNTVDGLYWFVNDETTVNDYHLSRVFVYDGADTTGESADSAAVMNVATVEAPLNRVGVASMVVENPQSDKIKSITSTTAVQTGPDAARSGVWFTTSPSVAPITKMVFEGTNAGMTGKIRLYGEREVTAKAQNVLPEMTFTAKQLVQEITDPVSGDFDFSGLDSTGVNRYIIETVGLESEEVTASSGVYCYVNEDTVLTNYHRQNFGTNGIIPASSPAALNAVSANVPIVGFVLGTTPEVADTETSISMVMDKPSGLKKKLIVSDWGQLRGAGDEVQNIRTTMGSIVSAPVTSLRFDCDTANNLKGTMRLYAEREVTTNQMHVLPQMDFTSKTLLGEYDPVAGEFDITIPDGYDTIYVEGSIKSTDTGLTQDALHFYINGDLTDTNYFYQGGYLAASTSGAFSSAIPFGGYAASSHASNPTTSYGTVRVRIPDYNDLTKEKLLETWTSCQEDSNSIRINDHVIIHPGDLARVSQLQIRSHDFGAGDLLLGKVRLYGEKSVSTVPAGAVNLPVTQSATFSGADGSVLWDDGSGWVAAQVVAPGQLTITFPTVAASVDEQSVYLSSIDNDATATHVVMRLLTASTVGVKSMENTSSTLQPRNIMVQRTLPSAPTLLPVNQNGKVEIGTYNPVSGVFDMDAIPAGYKRLIIEGHIRSLEVGENATAYLFFNDDAVAASYHCSRIGMNNGADPVGAGEELPIVAIMPGTTVPDADSYCRFRCVIEDYTGPYVKSAHSSFSFSQSATSIFQGESHIFWDGVTTPITRVRLQGFEADDLLGTLTLYGEM